MEWAGLRLEFRPSTDLSSRPCCRWSVPCTACVAFSSFLTPACCYLGDLCAQAGSSPGRLCGPRPPPASSAGVYGFVGVTSCLQSPAWMISRFRQDALLRRIMMSKHDLLLVCSCTFAQAARGLGACSCRQPFASTEETTVTRPFQRAIKRLEINAPTHTNVS